MGEIILPQDEEFEFNPFDWARASAMAHAQTLLQVTELTARVGSEQQTAAKLNAQLHDFIRTKKEAEDVMLQQFMVLLNEKKRKIRDQNRLLAGAEVDQPACMSVCVHSVFARLTLQHQQQLHRLEEIRGHAK